MASKVVIITGASSGIGQATAAEFARHSYNVVLAARRVDRLDQVAVQCKACAGSAGGHCFSVPTDVAEESQVQALVDKTMAAFGRVDVLVNNAGYGMFWRVDETPTPEMRRIFEVNFFGAFFGCKAVAPIMKSQGSGHIFNVSSVVGKRATPYHGGYSATKFALTGLAEALRVEMMPYHVHVTTICPALTDTEFFEASIRSQAAKHSFARFRKLTPSSVIARKIFATVGKNKPEIVFTAGGKFLVLLGQLWPAMADRLLYLYFKDLTRKMEQQKHD